MKWPFLKKKKTEVSEKIFERELMSINDVIAPSAMEFQQGYFKLGQRLAKSFFIFSYPRYLSAVWFSPVINLDTPLDISLFVHPIDTGLILRQLRRRVTEVQAELMEREEKGLIRSPELEIAFQDLEGLRDKLMSAQERMFKFGIYVTVYANTPEELQKLEVTLRSILESRLIYVKPALFQQQEGFINTSPYGLDQLSVHTTMNTEPLSSIFPFVSFDLSSNEGILYGINKHNNSLILFDRFSLENANTVIFAKSGSGKSVLGCEPVLIQNKHRVQLTKIGPLVEALIKKHGATQIEEELEGVINPSVKVYSFNENLKGEWSEVTVAARKKAPEVFYKFTTRGGREITTTGDHNMLVLSNGRVIAMKSSEIKEGEYVPLPREVSMADSFLNSFNLLDLLKNSQGIYVKGAESIIRQNYKTLHEASLDKRIDRYLYQYRNGRAVPIQYFWKILSYLRIKSNSPDLCKLKLTSRNGKERVHFNVDFKITPDFLKLVGYITSEGTVTKNCVMISNTDTEVLKDIEFIFKNLGIPSYYGSRGINSGCRVLVEIINTLGGCKNSKQKMVLPFIFSLDKAKISHFLSAYFEGDGGVEKSRLTISACSKSERLISEVTYLLYYFGIIARVRKTKKEPTNYNWKRKKIYYELSISGQDNLRKFAENINFISQRKKEQLLEIIKKEANTNVDIIPGIDSIFKEIYQLFGFQLHGIQDISNLKRGHYNPSQEKLKEIIKIIEERVQKFKDLASTFKVLSELPELAAIIELGKSQKKFNNVLWKTLGWSWGLMKKPEAEPKSNNIFKALSAINGNIYSLRGIKEMIHSGFQEMDLPVKYYNPSLQSALVERPESNTSYEMIQKAAKFVWQNYQEVLINQIPQVEEKLARLKILANSDLFWDLIVKIKKIENKKEKYVYDLMVDNEVFLAGQGGMFVHNSYMVKLELLRSLMLGVDCIILDPENEYEFLSDAVGGSFFRISLNSTHHINPFDLPIPREDERPEDVLRSNIINLVGLLRIMLGGLTAEEDAIIDRALTETYAAKDITPEIDPSLWGQRTPLMSDLETILENMEGAESLVKRVRKFTKGTFSGFFNQPTNISMENKMVVFALRDMEEELKTMAMFIVMRYIWNTIRSKLKKRILVIDEAWWMMQSEDSASFLFGTCKRARKYYLGVSTITQDVSDFMKSTYGQPIINNSSLQVLMKQSPAAIDVVQRTFNLTDEEKYLLLEAEVGEGLFFAGQKHVAIRVIASYAEDQIITTSPEQLLAIKKAKEEMAGGGTTEEKAEEK